jgi:hypothetical protein
MADICIYSENHDIPQSVTFPVECPECGAIRQPVWLDRQWCFPEHHTLLGTARQRRRYKLINGTWKIVES